MTRIVDYTSCKRCGELVGLAAGCAPGVWVSPSGEMFQPIAYGDELPVLEQLEIDRARGRGNPVACVDCHTATLGYHHAGCDSEKCPACGGAVARCGCGLTWRAVGTD